MYKRTMRKEECLNMFNTKLREFVNDLSRVYPDDPDLIKFKTSINMMLLVSDKDIIKMFKEFVHDKYNDRILIKDEDFFMKHDYNDVVDQNVDLTDQLIEKIKSYWTGMSCENKGTVWTYFTILIKLCGKYYSF